MSLVEILLVMAILSVVMLAVMSLYVPAHQSTVAQTQVTDVQSNLRLAVDRMTKDLLTAGFLTAGDAVVFENTNPPNTSADLVNDFTIRTRLVGDAFGRVVAAEIAGGLWLGFSDAAMVEAFPPGTMVRLFDPMVMREIYRPIPYDETDATQTSGLVYTVNANDVAHDIDGTLYPAIRLNLSPASAAPAETVVVRVPNTTSLPLQTIRYRLNDNSLERWVDGQRQILATNISDGQFTYHRVREGTTTQRIKQVDITLTGQTKGLKNDVISGQKTRSLQTSVTLRNVY
jgi:type II secretory pathway pseudopilin PulG